MNGSLNLMLKYLSNILYKLGLVTYLQRVEFAAHIGWSVAVGLIALFINPIVLILWVLFVLYDEFITDFHYLLFLGLDTKWQDLLWDLGSKLIPSLILGAIYLCIN